MLGKMCWRTKLLYINAGRFQFQFWPLVTNSLFKPHTLFIATLHKTYNSTNCATFPSLLHSPLKSFQFKTSLKIVSILRRRSVSCIFHPSQQDSVSSSFYTSSIMQFLDLGFSFDTFSFMKFYCNNWKVLSSFFNYILEILLS